MSRNAQVLLCMSACSASDINLPGISHDSTNMTLRRFPFRDTTAEATGAQALVLLVISKAHVPCEALDKGSRHHLRHVGSQRHTRVHNSGACDLSYVTGSDQVWTACATDRTDLRYICREV